eukprot:6245501-Lingulodinium_polyedra.AAC.1
MLPKTLGGDEVVDAPAIASPARLAARLDDEGLDRGEHPNVIHLLRQVVEVPGDDEGHAQAG